MTPWVFRLLIANVAMFFVTASFPELYRALMLVPGWVLVRPWTLVTYMFLHAGFGHLFFNMIGLFFFGPRLEATLGSRDFLRLYLFSGLGGAAFSFLFAPQAAVVGASGAVFGILLAFALLWPREKIFIWGVLPVEARWLIGFLGAMALFSGVTGAQSGIAHFAHLGGFAGGWLYLRWRKRKRRPQVVSPQENGPRAPAIPGAAEREARKAWESIRLEELHELNRDEVEKLLTKLQVGGVRGLSPEERAFLDRMARR